MHFRERGRSIQLVRTTYNAETKRPSTEVVGRLSRPDMEVTDEIKEKLTPEELAEIDAYRGRSGRHHAVAREYAVLTFPETVKTVVDWLNTASDAEAAAFAEDVHRPLGQLRRRLSKVATGEGEAGAEKPAKEPKKARGEKKVKAQA